MGEAVWVCVCQTVAARLSFTVSSALCACVCVCVSSLVRSSCLSACAFGFHLHMKLLNNPFVQQSGRHPCLELLLAHGLSCPGSRRTCIHFVFRSVRIRKCLNICKSS